MKQKLIVQDQEISILKDDYISLTDMVKNIDNGLVLIEKWLRNKNSIEFLGIWEEIYNQNFNSPEFEGIKNEAGLNRFSLSIKQWIKKTDAIEDKDAKMLEDMVNDAKSKHTMIEVASFPDLLKVAS